MFLKRRHFNFGLFTLALLAALGSFGFFRTVSAIGDYTGCLDGVDFVRPNDNWVINEAQNAKYVIEVNAGDCVNPDNPSPVSFSITGSSNNRTHGETIDSVSRVSGTNIFRYEWVLSNLDSKPSGAVSIAAKVNIKDKSSPLTKDIGPGETSGLSAILGTFAVYSQSTTQKPSCPTPVIATPAENAAVSGTANVKVTKPSGFAGEYTAVNIQILFENNTQVTQLEAREIAWNTTNSPNGIYKILVTASCDNNYQGVPQKYILVTVKNATSGGGSTSGVEGGKISYTTPSGLKIEVNPELLSIPIYKEVISAPISGLFIIREIKVDFPDKDRTKNKVKLSGQAKPDTKYELHIFSEPKELAVQTDKDGNWAVELGEQMEPGDHEAYLVLNDDTGKPKERSNVGNFFVPAAAAADSGGLLSADNKNRTRFLVIYGAIIVVSAIVLFIVYEAIHHRIKQRKQVNIPPPTPTSTV